jgi:hypothetical protein
MKHFLDFVGLVDDDGRLSRTNLAVYVAIGSMIVSLVRHGTIDWAPLGAFLIALLSYQAKRALLLQDKQADNCRTDADAVAQLKQTQAEHRVNLDALVASQNVVAAAVKNMTTALKARGAL